MKQETSSKWIIAFGSLIIALIAVVFTIGIQNNAALADYKVDAQREFVNKTDMTEIKADLKVIRNELQKVRIQITKIQANLDKK